MKDLRAKLKDGLKEQGIKLSYNHILMKVVAKALTEFPDVNASFADNMLTRHKHVNMGLAVAKGDGLIVPNVVSLFLGDDLRRSLPVVATGGAVLVLASDVVGRIVIAPYEIPVGTIMGVVGSLGFLTLIFWRRGHAA